MIRVEKDLSDSDVVVYQDEYHLNSGDSCVVGIINKDEKKLLKDFVTNHIKEII